jgi:hypothetical protein
MNDFQGKLEQLRLHARDCARSAGLEHPERELLGKLSKRLDELIVDLENIVADLNGREI